MAKEPIVEETIDTTTQKVELNPSGEFTFADIDFSEHEDLDGFEYDEEQDNIKEFTPEELKQNVEESIIKDNEKTKKDC
jgi:hypothetical protein